MSAMFQDNVSGKKEMYASGLYSYFIVLKIIKILPGEDSQNSNPQS
jgi:hypothetical protein